MSNPAPPTSRAIGRVQPQRDRLRTAHAAFEQACQQSEPSLTAVLGALDALRDAFDAHVAYAEGPGGLFEEMQDDAPIESAAAIDRLRRDHVTITTTMARSRALLTTAPSALEDQRITEAIAELARHLAQHRSRGAELLKDVYGHEVGGSD